jgi:hypothetical protein
MLVTVAEHYKKEIKDLLKNDDQWLEKLTGDQLVFLARTNPDLTETVVHYRKGQTRIVLKPECGNRYLLYKLLRSKKRVPQNEHAEEMLKKMEGNR